MDRLREQLRRRAIHTEPNHINAAVLIALLRTQPRPFAYGVDCAQTLDRRRFESDGIDDTERHRWTSVDGKLLGCATRAETGLGDVIADHGVDERRFAHAGIPQHEHVAFMDRLLGCRGGLHVDYMAVVVCHAVIIGTSHTAAPLAFSRQGRSIRWRDSAPRSLVL